MSLRISKRKSVDLALPVIADSLALILLLAVPARAARLATPAGINAFWLTSIYTIFLVGVYLLRKLAAVETESTGRLERLLHPRVRAALALLFGLAMMTGLAYQLGYFDVFLVVGQETVGEGESAALFVFGPSAWLLYSMFYVFVLAFPVRETIQHHSPRAPWIALFGLLAVNAMLLLTTAQIRALLPDGRFLWFLLIFLVLGLLFVPPRLLHAYNQNEWRGLLSQVILLFAAAAIVVW